MSKEIPNQNYKQSAGAGEVFVGLIIGTVFTVLALVDLSVLALDNNVFTAQYYIWKSQAAYVKMLVLILSLTLPLALLATITGLIQTFTRKATVVRNFMDWLQAAVLFYIVYISAVHIAPAEEYIVTAAVKGDLMEVGYQATAALYPHVLANVFCQLAMLLIPLVNYGDAQRNPVPTVPMPVVANKAKDGKAEAGKEAKAGKKD